MNERLKRDVLAILKDLDAGADGGDVALADLPRTRYQPTAPRVKRDTSASPWFPVVSTALWLAPLAIWTGILIGLSWWMGWRPSWGGWW